MKPLEILGMVIMAIGFITVYASPAIVKKYNLAQKQVCEHSAEMSEAEVQEFKYKKAVVQLKMLGLVVSIPGIVLFVLMGK